MSLASRFRWAGLVVAFGIAAFFMLKGLGGWIIVSDPLEKADAIVVLGGNLPFRSAEAARLFHEGWATRVWITAPESASELEAVKNLGLAATPVGQLSVRVLEVYGVPGSAIRVLSPHAEDTVEEIRLITSALTEAGLRRVIIVTSPTHTRRVRAIWRILARHGQRSFVHHIDRETFEPDRWWATERDRSRVMREISGLAFAWLVLPATSIMWRVSSTK
ncbi:MAG: YdcF family protein [Bryobacteraceae bacterium]|jgi:uncharacterized SAM-binding protein YcdF (DUF218 family)